MNVTVFDLPILNEYRETSVKPVTIPAILQGYVLAGMRLNHVLLINQSFADLACKLDDLRDYGMYAYFDLEDRMYYISKNNYATLDDAMATMIDCHAVAQINGKLYMTSRFVLSMINKSFNGKSGLEGRLKYHQEAEAFDQGFKCVLTLPGNPGYFAWNWNNMPRQQFMAKALDILAGLNFYGLPSSPKFIAYLSEQDLPESVLHHESLLEKMFRPVTHRFGDLEYIEKLKNATEDPRDVLAIEYYQKLVADYLVYEQSLPDDSSVLPKLYKLRRYSYTYKGGYDCFVFPEYF